MTKHHITILPRKQLYIKLLLDLQKIIGHRLVFLFFFFSRIHMVYSCSFLPFHGKDGTCDIQTIRVRPSLGHAVCCCPGLSWWPCEWFTGILLVISDQHVVPDYFNTYHQNALTSKAIPFFISSQTGTT